MSSTRTEPCTENPKQMYKELSEGDKMLFSAFFSAFTSTSLAFLKSIQQSRETNEKRVNR